MKFMKRTKERTEIEIENEERQAIYASHITTAMRDQGHRFVINPSFASVEDLNFGRMAFLGMNPEIEKMAADARAREEELQAQLDEKDVQDEEMAKHFSGVYKTVAQKFGSKPTFKASGGGGGGPSSSSSTSTAANSAAAAVISDSDAKQLLQKGGNLLNQIKSKNKVWKKKKNQFWKPKD